MILLKENLLQAESHATMQRRKAEENSTVLINKSNSTNSLNSMNLTTPKNSSSNFNNNETNNSLSRLLLNDSPMKRSRFVFVHNLGTLNYILSNYNYYHSPI